MTRRYTAAVAGLGVGGQHVDAFASQPDLFQLIAVCDLDSARAAAAAKQHPGVQAYADFGALIARDDLDIVSICTPPNTHCALALQALAAGKHVICEKPLVGSLADMDRIEAAQAVSRGRLMPVFQYRFGGGLQRLKRLVELGLAGRALLTTIETSWQRGPDYYAVPWRGKWATEMGGVCLTQAIHAHDMLTYINGPIKSVFARLTTRVNPIEVEDCAAVSVEMADGSLAALSATLGSATQISRLRFVFSGLTAESNLDPYRPSRDPWTFVAANPDHQAEIDAAVSSYTPGRLFFERQFELMHAALESGGPLPVTLADARASLELITAMYYSAETGARVDLPIGKDHPKYNGWTPAGGKFG